MTHPRRAMCTLAAVLAMALPPVVAAGAQRDTQRPSLTLRATPPVGFSPLRVRLAVEVRGGADDYEEFYCPTVEWEWGDGTISESSSDCDPYEAGRSSIQRRWSNEHIFRQAGTHRVVFRLKQNNRTVASANATVQVRAGMPDEFGR